MPSSRTSCPPWARAVAQQGSAELSFPLPIGATSEPGQVTDSAGWADTQVDQVAHDRLLCHGT
ncbi:hypothetical protein Q8G71_36310, partial [Klebsiella pneumoniae]